MMVEVLRVSTIRTKLKYPTSASIPHLIPHYYFFHYSAANMNGVAKDTLGGGPCCPIINKDENDDDVAGTMGAPGFAAIPTGPLNCSYNILLVYRLNEMRHIENLNFALAIACLGYW